MGALNLRWQHLGVWLAAAAVAVSCSSPPSQGAGHSAGGDGPAQSSKRVRVGILQEPKGWMPWGGTSTAGGAQQPYWFLTRTLTIIGGDGRIQPVLAEAIPALERGDWRIDPDGTMEQTWRIEPNAKWHDGRPVTGDDFVLGWEMVAHPSLPTTALDARGLIDAATAPDPAR